MGGSVCWGHVTGVTQDYTRTFAGNWTGTGTISGSGDDEEIQLSNGENLLSEIWHTGASLVEIILNDYVAGDTPDNFEYRTGATVGDVGSAGWNSYVGAFNSLGYVQVRLSMN